MTQLARRGFLGFSLGTVAASLFPEVVTAMTKPVPQDPSDTPWQWQPRDTREMTEEERVKYLPLFEPDIQVTEKLLGARNSEIPPSMSISLNRTSSVLALGVPIGTSYIYARHIEIAPSGKILRAATTTFFALEEDQSIALHSLGADAHGAALSRSQFEAKAGCAAGTHSCRACSQQNSVGILACCGGCLWASWNWLAFSSCALIMCSVCASQNCLRWTYACCPN